MGNRKFVFIGLVLFVVFIGCEKVRKAGANEEEKHSLLELNNECLNKRTINSVFQTCGGACTIIYNEKKISLVDSLIKIDFDAEMYLYEDLEDTFSGAFFVKCNSQNKAVLIYFEGDEKKDMLKVNVNDTSESFQEYGDELCSCLENEDN